MVLQLDLGFHLMETLEVHLTEYLLVLGSTLMDLLFPIHHQWLLMGYHLALGLHQMGTLVLHLMEYHLVLESIQMGPPFLG